MTREFLADVLAWDDALQIAGMLLSVVGVLLSVQAVWETHVLRWRVTHPGHVAVLRSHLVSHAVMLYLQLTFGTISVLVATVPPLPLEMLASPDHQWILVVVTLRKILRAGAIVVLCAATIYKRRERRTMLGR